MESFLIIRYFLRREALLTEGKKKGFYSSSMPEDMIICAGASYCTAAFCCDNYLPENVMTAVRIASLCIMALCWWWLSFFNGLRKRKSFAVFSGAFNLLPPVLVFLINRFKTLKFSDLGILTSEISRIISRFPYKILENVSGINGMFFSAAMAVICLMLFSAGYIYTCRLLDTDF